MGEEELIETWTDKLCDELRLEGATPRKAIQEVLHKVFLVGIETGKEQEMLKKQLEGLGKPHGHD